MSLIPVEFVNPFFAATRKICGDTLKVPVVAGKPRLCGVDERMWKLYQISAAIKLSDAVCGLIGLSFSESVALALAGGLACATFASFNDDAKDALGEVANLIIGTAKRELPGGLVSISTPQIVHTEKLEFPIGLPVMILPFESSPGRFLMQLSLKSQPSVKQAA